MLNFLVTCMFLASICVCHLWCHVTPLSKICTLYTPIPQKKLNVVMSIFWRLFLMRYIISCYHAVEIFD